jgi:hypothetical protein
MSEHCGGPVSEPTQERAVVDRIDEGVAVLLVGPSEREVTVPASELPDGAAEGSWLRVRGQDAELELLDLDDAADARRAEADERLDRLRRTRGSGRFRRT